MVLRQILWSNQIVGVLLSIFVGVEPTKIEQVVSGEKHLLQMKVARCHFHLLAGDGS